MMAEFKTKHPNPTRQQLYERCLNALSFLNEGYRYHNTPKSTQASIIEQCDKSDVRKFGPREE